MFRHPMAWLGLALVIAMLVFWERPPTDLFQPIPEVPPTFPQAYTKNLETRVFDEEGQLHYHLTAQKAEHFQLDPRRAGDRDYSLIEQPRMTMHSQDAAPWRLHAEMGRVDAEGDRVFLYEGVRAWQNGDRGMTEFITSELWVEPPKEYAHTDKAVKMRAEQGTTDAVGMQVNLGEERIELLSDVQSVYHGQREGTNDKP